METAGLCNTAGFNDDARNFCSIPSRHDLSRRADANWLGTQVARGLLGMEEALEMASEMACGLARRTYRLE
jgi:glucuronate isomerase